MLLRRDVLAMAGALAALPSHAFAQAASGVRALIITQGYADTPRLRLPNAVRDGQLVAATLRRIGIAPITALEDRPAVDTLAAIAGFLAGLRPDETILTYVAGHGYQVLDENLLMLNGGQSYISLQSLVEALKRRADTVVLFLDACRNNPYDPPPPTAQVSRSAGQVGSADLVVEPLSLGDPAERTLEQPGQLRPFSLQGAGVKIVFATDPYNVALDGASQNSRNSPFAAALTRRLTERRSLDDVVSLATGDVVELSNGRQTPWSQGSIERPIFLAGPPIQRNPARPRFQVPG